MHTTSVLRHPLRLPLLLAAAFAVCTAPAPAAPSPDVQAVSAAGTDFGFRLLQVLATDHADWPNANVFFSPFSLSQALTLTMNGAGGQTQTVMAKTLDLSALPQDKINAANIQLLPALTSDPKVQISAANAIWATKRSRSLQRSKPTPSSFTTRKPRRLTSTLPKWRWSSTLGPARTH